MSSLRSDASNINCCTTWSCRLSRVYWIVGREERVRRGEERKRREEEEGRRGRISSRRGKKGRRREERGKEAIKEEEGKRSWALSQTE